MTPIIGKALAILMIGSTHYVDVGQSEDAVIYYPTETTAHMQLPGKPALTGDLRLLDNGYFVNWQSGPEGNWQIAYSPGTFTYLGPDGKPAGIITKIVPGNPEQLR